MKRLLLIISFFSSFSCLAQQDINVQHYRFEIELSDVSDVINGKATIHIAFRRDVTRLTLDLASPEEDHGMQAFIVKDATDGQSLNFIHRNNRLTIDLKRKASAGETRVIEVEYMGKPRDGLIISRNKYGERTFFADNWPDRAHEWIPCNDVPSDKASVEFIVKAPSHYRIISNGNLLEEKSLSGNITRTHWKEEALLPTKVMVIGAARFAVARVDSSYRIPVTAWIYQKDSAQGVFDYSITDDILRFFEEYIGPYPYKKLANVQSKTIFGGMENANAIFYAENTVTGDRQSEDLMAHEIVHQWFGNTATEKTFAHLWLSEGFATYLTNIYFEQKYGRQKFVERLMEEKVKIISFAKRSNSPVVDSTSPLMDLLNANSYQKGGWILHMLRSEVGDKHFKKIIQAYYQQYKDSNADTRDFQKVAETVSGKDLKWFFDQWLYGSGMPELDFKMKLDGDKELKIEIKQEQRNLFRFPLEVTIIEEDGGTTFQTIEVKERETEFKMKVKGPVKVQIDQEKILYTTKDSKKKNVN